MGFEDFCLIFKTLRLLLSFFSQAGMSVWGYMMKMRNGSACFFTSSYRIGLAINDLFWSSRHHNIHELFRFHYSFIMISVIWGYDRISICSVQSSQL